MARTVEITFTGCTQADESLGTGSEHILSSVHFDARIGAELRRGLSVIVHQPRVYNVLDRGGVPPDVLEVEKPRGNAGSIWSHHAFADAVGTYFRRLFNPAAQGFMNVAPVRNRYFAMKWTTTFEIPDDGKAAW